MVLSVDDDVQLSVVQYRNKLYEVQHDSRITSNLMSFAFCSTLLTNLTVYVPADDAGEEDQSRDSQTDPAQGGRLWHDSTLSDRGE